MIKLSCPPLRLLWQERKRERERERGVLGARISTYLHVCLIGNGNSKKFELREMLGRCAAVVMQAEEELEARFLLPCLNLAYRASFNLIRSSWPKSVLILALRPRTNRLHGAEIINGPLERWKFSFGLGNLVTSIVGKRKARGGEGGIP